MAFFEKLLAGLTLKGFDAIAEELKNNAIFKRDLGAFVSTSKAEIDLEAFSLGSRRSIQEMKDQFSLENVYVPMRVDQLKPTFGFNALHPDENRFTNTEEKGLIQDCDFFELVKLIDENVHFRSVLIQGNAGAGKSTFMKYLALSFHSKGEIEFKRLVISEEGEGSLENIKFKPFYVPIIIRLRELEEAVKVAGNRSWVSSFHLGDFLKYKYNLSFESDFYTNLFRKAPVLILFDGIDEVPELKKLGNLDISQKKAQEWIIRQKESILENNSLARVILTSRPNNTEALWRKFEVFKIHDLKEVEVKCFTDNWYTEYERQLKKDYETFPQRKSRIKNKLECLDSSMGEFLNKAVQPPLSKIIKNPLLLSLALIMHAIEGQLSATSVKDLYKNFINAFLYKWDDVRNMNFYPELLGNRNWDHLFTLLYRIAYQFSLKDTRQMKAREILECLEENIPKLNKEIAPERLGSLSRELLEKFRDRAGLLTGKEVDESNFEETIFEFQHQTFQEYLTALAIHEEDLLEESSLNDKVGIRQWKETIEFYLELGASKRFFKLFAETKSSKKKFSPYVNHIVHYWLSPQEKYFFAEWQEDLEEWLVEMFYTTQDWDQLRKVSVSLSQIPTPELSKLENLVIEFTHGNTLEALKLGLAVVLLQKKGRWGAIKDVLEVKFRMLKNQEAHYLLPLTFIQVAAFWERDKQLISFFDHEFEELILQKDRTPGKGSGVIFYHYLMSLKPIVEILDTEGFEGWEDFYALKDIYKWESLFKYEDFLGFEGFREFRCLVGLIGMFDMRDSRGARIDLREFVGWREAIEFQFLMEDLIMNDEGFDGKTTSQGELERINEEGLQEAFLRSSDRISDEVLLRVVKINKTRNSI